MSPNQKLTDAVRYVLKTKARVGQTTKTDATQLVVRRIQDTGGPTKYGIGVAALRMALNHIVQVEVTRQFKAGLSDHATTYLLPKNGHADEFAKYLGKLPAWIAVEEGPHAIWVNSLKARPEHWMANALLKEKKAQQTIDRANISTDIAHYLRRYNLKSLEDVLEERAGSPDADV